MLSFLRKFSSLHRHVLAIYGFSAIALCLLAQCTNFQSQRPVETEPPTYWDPVGDRVLGQPTGRRYSQRELDMEKPQGVYTEDGRLYVMDSNHHRILIWETIPTKNNTPPDYVLAKLDMRDTTPVTTAGNTLLFPTQVSVYEGDVYAADNNNHRILKWNKGILKSAQYADGILGQTLFTTNAFVSDNLIMTGFFYVNTFLRLPESQGYKFFAADNDNHRVLVWNEMPSFTPETVQPADFQLGSGISSQVEGVVTLGNFGPGGGPRGMFSYGTRLYVGDPSNNRILLYNSIPEDPDPDITTDYVSADLAIISAGSALNEPFSLSGDASRFIVADKGNHRVLIFNSHPTTSTPTPAAVVGTGLATNPPSAGTLNLPHAAHTDGTRLYVADMENNRVLIWNTIPTTNGQAADVVLGQDTFNTTTTNIERWNPKFHFKSPSGSSVSNHFLAVADTLNHRVLLWKNYPDDDGAAPYAVVGQPSEEATTAMTDTDDETFLHSLNRPTGVAIHEVEEADGTQILKMIICDYLNSRLVVHPNLTVKSPASDWTLTNNFQRNRIGETPLTPYILSGANHTLPGGARPISIFFDGQRVLVSTSNHQVLVWNRFQDVGLIGDARILGTGEAGTTQNQLSSPRGVFSDGTRIFVVDTGNRRVMVWNSLPEADGANADLVIGQPDFDTVTANSDQPHSPRGVTVSDEGKLFVSDHLRHRILVWNTVPTTNGVAPDGYLGQSDNANGTTANAGGPVTFKTFSRPDGLTSYRGKLYITDTLNHRLIIMSPAEIYPEPIEED